LAALIPDIDHPESTIAHMLGPLWRFVFKLARRLSSGVEIVNELFEHRGPSHRPAGLGRRHHTASMFVGLVLPPFLVTVLAVAIGWLTHPLAR